MIDGPGPTSPAVRIRELLAGDVSDIAAWLDDPGVRSELAVEPGLAAADWLAGVVDRDDRSGTSDRRLLAIETEGAVVGLVQLAVDSRADRRVEIGFVVAAAHRRRGVASVAVDLARSEALAEGFHRLWAVCDPDNTAARRVLERAGFRREGRLRHDRLVAGRWRDSLLFGWVDDGADALADEESRTRPRIAPRCP